MCITALKMVLFLQGELGEPGQKGSKGDKGEHVSLLHAYNILFLKLFVSCMLFCGEYQDFI